MARRMWRENISQVEIVGKKEREKEERKRISTKGEGRNNEIKKDVRRKDREANKDFDDLKKKKSDKEILNETRRK